ncbi:MAG TPA: hypothetical protein VME20_03900 [Acidimicrobiales bacterium]|nr:hypothetical protein [Acidimicrobiales bacterium]
MPGVHKGIRVLVLWGALVASGSAVGSPAAAEAISGTTSVPTTVRVFTSGSLPLPGDSSVPIQVTASGALNFVTGTASITLHVPGRLAMTFPGGSDKPTTVDLLLVKAVVYLSYPGLALATGGKSWVTVGEGSSEGMATFFQFIAMYLADVPAQLRKEPADEAHRLGTSIIDGVKAMGYLIDLPRPPYGLTKFWYWVDAENQLVQNKVMAVPAKGLPTTGTTDYFSYNTPVSVAAPPASEVKAEPSSVFTKYLSTAYGVIELVI